MLRYGRLASLESTGSFVRGRADHIDLVNRPRWLKPGAYRGASVVTRTVCIVLYELQTYHEPGTMLMAMSLPKAAAGILSVFCER